MNLNGKKALIMGLANQRSIAWGIAKSLQQAGAEIGLSYLEAMEKRVKPLAEELKATLMCPCDVSSDDSIAHLAFELEKEWSGEFDILVHSLAFAEREDMDRAFVETSREGFQKALDISAYSFIAVTKACLPMLEKRQGSALTMTYHGSQKVVPNYNVMGVAKAALEASVRYLAYDCGARGVRVNAISAGPIRTLAASGVPGFRDMLSEFEQKAPLKRLVSIEDVGEAARFLASDSARGITGEILYVDAGHNIMGL